MKNITFLQLAEGILSETKKPMTTEEIWHYAENNGWSQNLNSKGKTPWASIGAQIYISMRDKPKNTPFVHIDSKPTKFFLKELMDSVSISDLSKEIEQPQKTKYNERDLHPLLAYYAHTYLRIYTKTIYHEKSAKKTYTQWLHPDLVGVSFPINEWEQETLNLGTALGSPLVKLYSFEIKKEITFANLRQSFFQAVSNSSWANEGYLVAAKISENEEFYNELRRLSSAFGIGIIRLNIDDPDASETIFAAKFKADMDWETINKLCKENPDFKKFTIRVKNDLTNKEIITSLYDKIYERDQLLSMIKK
ncbi:COG2958 family protein [Shimazuella kribbensis]|uniref:COG2958 family protein n=1 Tax=Shimazuella kribbensis TaxID=139808 RepID=UPI0004286C7A|nr:HTH domain-containing protein [Shimazuella kribbensis]